MDMTMTNNGSSENRTMRQQAEKLAASEPARAQDVLQPAEMSAALHELEVHKIELEMQNEELRSAHVALQESKSRYFDLYDLAPVGYLTLCEKGMILEANLATSSLLGVKRAILAGKYLTSFILSDDQPIYYRHWKQMINQIPAKTLINPLDSVHGNGAGATHVSQVDTSYECEVRMQRTGTSPFWARVEATISYEANGTTVHCTILSDITKLKHAENVLLENNIELARFNRAAVDRELRMIELKQEVNGLRIRLGLPPAYDIESRKDQ